jgi:ribosomal protein S13
LSGASNDSNESLPGSCTKRLSSCLEEAFALIMLKNNYFAWLLEYREKSTRMVLLTDYDRCVLESSHTIAPVAKHVLGGNFIDLLSNDENQRCTEEKDYVVWKPKDGDEEEVKVKYMNAATDYKASCDAIRLQVSTSTEYKDVAEYVKELITVKDFSDKKAKRQKLMKDHKAYTGKREEDETRQRGWNTKTFEELFALKAKINEEKRRLYKKFGLVYRKVYEASRGGSVSGKGQQSTKGLLTDKQHKILFEEEDDDDDDNRLKG